MKKMIYIDCPICKSKNSKKAYECFQETGKFLGRIKTTFVICSNCGFMYMNPRPIKKTIDKYYFSNIHASGNVYHDIAQGSRNNQKNENRKRFFSNFIKHKSGKMLEIGCSDGEFIESLGLNRWENFAVEPSPISAQKARRKGINVYNGFIENSKYQKECFDIVCCFSVLEHIYDINMFAEKISTLIKPGGLLWVEVPDSLKPIAQLTEFFTFEHLSNFTKSTLIYFLTKYNFGDYIFDEVANESRLRVCARKINLQKIQKSTGQTSNAVLKQEIFKYRKNKKELEREIAKRLLYFIHRWQAERKKIAIYGAGIHTIFLLNLLNINNEIIAIIDSDPKKHGKRFMRWKVHDESILAKGDINAVIISSKPFQDEIYNKISKYEKNKSVEIVKCYI
jgi:2-polyprenyl-3-methyl-5-hydroxy-6-metoxy-1,4-benzoquinol methylase